MPYVIRKRGTKYCVVSTTSGKTHGCHPSRAKARAQQRALYANAPESAMEGFSRANPEWGSKDVFTPSGESPTLPHAVLQEESQMDVEVKNTIWNLRLTPETKRLWNEAAEAEGMSLSEYVRGTVTDQALLTLKPEDEGGPDLNAAVEAITNLATAGLSEKEIKDGAEGVAALLAEAEVVAADDPLAEDVDETREPFEGVLGTIGSPTSDSRYLVPGEIDNRDLPLPFSVQPALAEGHDGAINSGRIESITYIPWAEFDRQEEFYSDEQIASMNPEATVIWGEGTVDGSPAGLEAKRQIENGADVSLDGLRFNGLLYDAETFAQVTEADVAELEMGDVFQKIMEGAYLQGVAGKIGGATVVSIGAFEEARVIVTASASLRIVDGYDAGAKFAVLVAAAGPVKPPREWFEDPQLSELTPLTIDKDGRVFGHLADWDGCHIGFQGVCVPPFASQSNYAYFNVGQIETAEGMLVPCGKLMFCMDGNGHAPTDPQLSYRDVQRYYDDATKVGAFVRAGSDRFGTWLAGALRPGLTDIEVQHLRTHGPSGDWRPIKGGDSDLIAAFAVPVQGFPIARPQSLVASAGGEITAIITAPLSLEKKYEEMARFRSEQERAERAANDKHALLRRRAMLLAELQEIGFPESEEAEESEAEEASEESPFDDGYTEEFAISAADRKRMAKSGEAMPDGSFPITKCTGAGTSAENARQAIGRAPEGKRAAVKAHIQKRERALGCSSKDEDSND